MENRINLHLVSPITGSIFEISKDLKEIFEKEFNLSTEWESENNSNREREILFCHFLDPQVVNHNNFNKFKFKVLIQPIDGTEMVKEAVDMINKFDLIICPADSSKKIMKKNGIKTKIEIIPNYFKSDIFEKDIYHPILDHIPNDKIVFYHESTFHPRKGIEILLEGFIKAFSDTPLAEKVVLVLKDMPYHNNTFFRTEKIKKQAIKLQSRFKNPAMILKFSCFLNDEELKHLWYRTNIYTSMSKIEGFGIPLLRMLLLNKPILCLENENSGYTDYLNKGNSYQIPTIQHFAKDEPMWLYTKNSMWAIPNINDVIDYFRIITNDYLSNNLKTIQKTSVDTFNGIIFENKKNEYIKKYSLENISNQYISIIKKHFLEKLNN